MKKLAVLIVLLLSLNALAQSPEYNLANLKSVKLQIFDPSQALDSGTSRKLISEIRIKLTSLGIDVKEDNHTAALQFKIDLGVYGILTNPDVLLRLELLEKVSTFRSAMTRTEAKTYSGIQFQTIPKQELNEKCYSILMDKLFLPFLDKWIEDNKK